MHRADGELLFLELFSDLIDSLLGVAVDDALPDIDVAVELNQSVEFPLIFTYTDVKLFDTVQCQFLVGEKDLGGVSEEGIGQLVDVMGQSGREQSNLHIGGQILENISN